MGKDRKDFLEAARAAAFTVPEPTAAEAEAGWVSSDAGRTLIHCMTGSIGADWDADAVYGMIEKGDEVWWNPANIFGHELIVRVGHDVFAFNVKRPRGSARFEAARMVLQHPSIEERFRPFITDDIDWLGIERVAEEQSLSDGELVLVNCAYAFWGAAVRLVGDARHAPLLQVIVDRLDAPSVALISRALHERINDRLVKAAADAIDGATGRGRR